MDSERLAQLLVALTPERLSEVVLDLVSRQAPGNRAGVATSTIFDVLIAGQDLGEGSQRWQAYTRVRQAIMDAVTKIPGMKYVQSSA